MNTGRHFNFIPMTPQEIRSIWIKIAIPLGFSVLLLATGLILRSLGRHDLAAPGAFMCLGGTVGILLFGSKAIQFMSYLKKNK
jgi:hypothetical protein